MFEAKEKGKIYGFVGVIGSGKTYAFDKKLLECRNKNMPVVTGDFSDGIRDTVMYILTGRKLEIDLQSNVYNQWKNMQHDFLVPGKNGQLYLVLPTGRELLQRTGEFLKELAGDGVWARYTALKIYDDLMKFPKEIESTNVLFGSVRFFDEVRELFYLGEKLNKRVEIRFCNFKSPRYKLDNHISEKLAQTMLEKGYEDGDDITDILKQMC